MLKSDGAHLEADSLSTLKSTFTFGRRARPPLPTGPLEHVERTPLNQGTNKLTRRESRGGLRSMFTRNKASSDPSHLIPTSKEGIITEASSIEKSVSLTGNTGVGLEVPMERVYAKSTASTPERRAALRMTMRPIYMKTRPVSRGNPKQTSKPISTPPRRTMAAWDPPPLFQAYPQAIKHAQLSSSTLSADSILRMSNHRRNNSIREDIVQSGIGAGQAQTGAAKKTEKIRSKHRRQLSGSFSKADWTQKIYMLVTSGYLLQYSGDGSFDRLPEKMMQLGKDSVAFASDVIPGKHWVLQVSQAMDSDGIPAPDPRSLLSRLTFRGADYRRTATSFLLILDSAEDLESWITTVRREIEALGGKKYVSETGKPKVDDEDIHLIKEQPSHRYLVQRGPDRFSNPPTPRTLSCDPQWRHSGDVEYQESTAPGFRSQHAVGPSANRLSVATSSASHDSQLYEGLKDNSFRLSYMSSGQRTLVTSQGTSPACSPTRETFITIEESRMNGHVEEPRSRPNATAISDRRRSMQAIQNSTMQSPAVEFQPAPKVPKTRPHSTYGSPGRATILTSPSTPNFSVPHSMSKRYTLAKISDNSSTSLSAQPSTTNREPNTSMKGKRKSPPAPLKAPQLSPVRDHPSPVRSVPVYTPTGSSFQKVPTSKPSIVEIRPNSQNGSPRRNLKLAIESPSSTRRPGYLPPVIVQKQVQSYRQSGQQVISNTVPDVPRKPDRMPPVPPASPRMLPLPPSPRIIPSQLEAMPIDDGNESLVLQDDSGTPASRPASIILPAKSSENVTSGTMPPPNGTITSITLPASKSTTPPRISLPAITPQSPSVPHLAPSLTPLSVQKLKSGSAKKDLLNRRSMPQLVKGPPPAPPPNYALPPIPVGMRNPLEFKGDRNSVTV